MVGEECLTGKGCFIPEVQSIASLQQTSKCVESETLREEIE